MKDKSNPGLYLAATDLQNELERFLREYKNGGVDNKILLKLSDQLKDKLVHFEIILYEIQEELKTPVQEK